MPTNKYFLLVLAFFGLVQPTQAQPLRQRFFLGMEASVCGTENLGPAAITLAAEPKLWLANRFYLGLKFEGSLGSFGKSQYSPETETALGSLYYLSAKGYYEHRILSARMFVGYGGGRMLGNSYFEKDERFNGSNSRFDTLRVQPQWFTELSIGAKADRLYFLLSLKSPSKKMFDYDGIARIASSTLGLEFGEGRRMSRFSNNDDYPLPPLMLEIGRQVAVPIGKAPNAACRSDYIEMKVGFKQRYSIGARLLDFFRKPYGDDRDGYSADLLGQVTTNYFYTEDIEVNSMSLVRSNTLFLDYYLPMKQGWAYCGLGGGWHRFRGLDDIDLQYANGQTAYVPGIAAVGKRGLLLRIGHKAGFFRTGLDLNITGSGVPDFASFHIGLEPGLFFQRGSGEGR